jgi:hypothetical protein
MFATKNTIVPLDCLDPEIIGASFPFWTQGGQSQGFRGFGGQIDRNVWRISLWILGSALYFDNPIFLVVVAGLLWFYRHVKLGIP